jgi:hypothetical protein
MGVLYNALMFIGFCLALFLLVSLVRLFSTVRSEVVFGRSLILYGIGLYILFSIVAPLVVRYFLVSFFSASVLEVVLLIGVLMECVAMIMVFVGFRRHILRN